MASDPEEYLLTAEMALPIWRDNPDALLLVDEGGVIRLANPAAELMFGFPRAELLGQPVEILIPEDRRARHEAHRQSYADEPRRRAMGTTGLDLQGRRKDGRSLRVEINLSPVVSQRGVYTIAAIRRIPG